ncbi:Heterogeneous nuclear ribonucleoprotein 1-like protein [Drosera capensis]
MSLRSDSSVPKSNTTEKKLVVLGIPWDVDSDGLKEYMSRFGEIEDCIVMKERATGRSRGFGYVTFASVEVAKKALSSEHTLGNRPLEVKVATPKEEMMRTSTKKVTRIFVARIPQSVTENAFRSHFEKYGEIVDLYMPKDPAGKAHRGIGFITFDNAESVDNLISDSHELGGTTVVVDRATPKQEEERPFSRVPQEGFRSSRVSQGGYPSSRLPSGGYPSSRLPPRGYPPGRLPQEGYLSSRVPQGGYGAYDAYINAATRYAALGAPTLYDPPGSMYGRGDPVRGGSRKIFVGRLPPEANADDLRQYFSRFGRILDAYVPKDPKRPGHRGFGFVTFAEDGAVDRVAARRSHEICGHEVAIDTATPLADDAGSSRSLMVDRAEPLYGPMRDYGRMHSSLDYDDWGYGPSGARPSRPDWRVF